jgi:hypothetical protein
VAALAQLHHLVEHALRDFPLRGLGDFDNFVMGNDCDCVAVGIEANALARNVIHDNRIERLRGQLLARILKNVLGFGGKTNNDLGDCLLCAKSAECPPSAQVQASSVPCA